MSTVNLHNPKIKKYGSVTSFVKLELNPYKITSDKNPSS